VSIPSCLGFLFSFFILSCVLQS